MTQLLSLISPSNTLQSAHRLHSALNSTRRERGGGSAQEHSWEEVRHAGRSITRRRRWGERGRICHLDVTEATWTELDRLPWRNTRNWTVRVLWPNDHAVNVQVMGTLAQGATALEWELLPKRAKGGGSSETGCWVCWGGHSQGGAPCTWAVQSPGLGAWAEQKKHPLHLVLSAAWLWTRDQLSYIPAMMDSTLKLWTETHLSFLPQCHNYCQEDPNAEAAGTRGRRQLAGTWSHIRSLQSGHHPRPL